jgi:hypothetical protein
MPKHLETLDDVIAELGGLSKVARLVRRKPSTVAWWRDENKRVPPKFYFKIIEALMENGCDAPRTLFGFELDADAA